MEKSKKEDSRKKNLFQEGTPYLLVLLMLFTAFLSAELKSNPEERNLFILWLSIYLSLILTAILAGRLFELFKED